jgi:hypothetical protein
VKVTRVNDVGVAGLHRVVELAGEARTGLREVDRLGWDWGRGGSEAEAEGCEVSEEACHVGLLS